MTGIPLRMVDRPVVGGRAVPWVNLLLRDGGADFRGTHRSKVESCWRDGLCQGCGQRLTIPMVLLCGPRQREEGVFDEPPLHPECARYATRACPMVAGERTTYAAAPHISTGPRGDACPNPDCDCDGWVPADGTPHHGDPAHEWYAIWVDGYTLAVRPDGTLHGGAVAPAAYRRVRLVGTPGAGQAVR